MQSRGRGKIRPPRRGIPIRADADEVEASLRQLEDVIGDVINGKAVQLSYEQLYRTAYKIVLRKKSDQLYDVVEKKVYETLGVRLRALGHPEFNSYAVARTTKPDFQDEREGVELKLFELKQAWADNQISGAMISDILMYLDRAYVVEMGKPSTTQLVSLAFARAFHDVRYLREGDDVTAPCEVLMQFFSEQLDRHRQGEIVDLSLLEKVATCLREASEHTKPGESPYAALESGALVSTRDFYKAEAESWRQHASAEMYEDQVTRRIEEEETRCKAVFGEEAAILFSQAARSEFDKLRPTKPESPTT